MSYPHPERDSKEQQLKERQNRRLVLLVPIAFIAAGRLLATLGAFTGSMKAQNVVAMLIAMPTLGMFWGAALVAASGDKEPRPRLRWMRIHDL